VYVYIHTYIHTCIHTYYIVPVKSLKVFERILFSTKLHLFDQKYSKICEILLRFELTGFWISCKAEFSASLHQSCTHEVSVSHGPSEIILICWFCAQETCSCYYQCWKQPCCLIFLWKLWFFFPPHRILRWIES